MTSSSEEDASGGVEGRDGLSESVTYPRFFLVGMTSSSDLSSPLTGAGAGAGDASGTRLRSAAASSLEAPARRSAGPRAKSPMLFTRVGVEAR